MTPIEEKNKLDTVLLQFKNQEVKAKNVFQIREIDKNTAYEFVRRHHYLADAKFFAKYSFGLFVGEELVGAATYSNPQGIVAMKSWFNLPNSDQQVVELSRLCMLPPLNGTNATSFLLGNSLQLLRPKGVKAVITLADSSRHVGSIYQVCNFKYYGLTDMKSDFFAADGRVNPRGPTKNVQGVWLPRTRKHRYCYLLDSRFPILLVEQPKPIRGTVNTYVCCQGTGKVLDRRFGVTYPCPKCFQHASEANDAA